MQRISSCDGERQGIVRTSKIAEEGDAEEGLTAAGTIGDDRMQKQSQGDVVPDAFTHGSSAQRVRWCERGLQSGDPNHCDTFGVAKV
jgi:predicted metalloprotease